MGAFDTASEVFGTRRVASRLADVLGSETALATVSKAPSMAEYLSRLRQESASEIGDGVGTIVGAAAGAVLYKDHRVLGAIEGASIGRNGPALAHSHLRREALCNMGQTSFAVAVSRIAGGSPVAFVLAWVAAGGAIYYWKLRGPR